MARSGLHLVDLNGAIAGKPKNHAAIKAILDTLDDDVPVELGGGIRDMATIEAYLDDGIHLGDSRHRGGEKPGLFA